MHSYSLRWDVKSVVHISTADSVGGHCCIDRTGAWNHSWNEQKGENSPASGDLFHQCDSVYPDVTVCITDRAKFPVCIDVSGSI